MILSLSLLPHVSLYIPLLPLTPAVLVTDSVIKLSVTVSSHFLFSICFACNITSIQLLICNFLLKSSQRFRVRFFCFFFKK